MKKLLIFLPLVIGLTYAKKGLNIPFKKTIAFNDKKLVLNGTGLRTAAIYKKKIYIAALYLEEKSSKYKEILSSKAPKVLILHFLMKLSSEKLRKSFEDGFTTNKVDVDSYKQQIRQLTKNIKDVKKGDRIIIKLDNGKIQLRQKKLLVKMEDKAFARDLLRIWVDQAPTEEFKKGLLGLKK
jgi:hypothetical protein